MRNAVDYTPKWRTLRLSYFVVGVLDRFWRDPRFLEAGHGTHPGRGAGALEARGEPGAADRGTGLEAHRAGQGLGLLLSVARRGRYAVLHHLLEDEPVALFWLRRRRQRDRLGD